MAVTRLYLDAGGAAPVSARTAEALHAGLADGWADPARLGAEARKARALLDGAREAIADGLDLNPTDVFFTPSPHFAIERAIAGIAQARRGSDRVVVSAIERNVTFHAAAHVAKHAVDAVPVDAQGHVDLGILAQAVARPGINLAAIQHANQEIGTVQDTDAVYELAAKSGVPLLVDATASIGHIDPPQSWDALVAHPADWGAPQGLGVLALRPRTRWLAAWPEGDPFAPGGVSVPIALAAAVALQERRESMAANGTRLHALIDRIRAAVAQIDGVDLVGDPAHRLPHVLTFSCLYVDGESLLTRLDRDGIAVGSGSACTTDTLEPSHVLAAVGALTHGNVRVGLHPGVTDADVDRFLSVLPRAIADVRGHLGAPAAR